MRWCARSSWWWRERFRYVYDGVCTRVMLTVVYVKTHDVLRLVRKMEGERMRDVGFVNWEFQLSGARQPQRRKRQVPAQRNARISVLMLARRVASDATGNANRLLLDCAHNDEDLLMSASRSLSLGSGNTPNGPCFVQIRIACVFYDFIFIVSRHTHARFIDMRSTSRDDREMKHATNTPMSTISAACDSGDMRHKILAPHLHDGNNDDVDTTMTCWKVRRIEYLNTVPQRGRWLRGHEQNRKRREHTQKKLYRESSYLS